MKKSNYWYVEQTHSASQYNDSDEFTIFNGDNERIVADDAFYIRGVLDKIVLEHNKCFFDEE